MTDIDLSKVLTKEAVTLNHEPFASKEEMFDFMSKKFLDAGIITDQQAYIRALEDVRKWDLPIWKLHWPSSWKMR